MRTERVKRITIGEQVYEQLKERILRREWTPGEKLPSENELSENFGVSRITIRQAIQKMATLGIVETKFGDGTYVLPYTPGMVMNNIIPFAYLGENSLLEVLEFRKVIEAPTAELAAQKATNQDIRSIENIYQRMLFMRDCKSGFFQADFDFHLEIANITNNSLIINTYTILQNVLKVAMEKIVDVRGHEHGIYYHRLIIDAMKSRDSQSCRKVMEDHINDTYDSMVELLNANPENGLYRN